MENGEVAEDGCSVKTDEIVRENYYCILRMLKFGEKEPSIRSHARPLLPVSTLFTYFCLRAGLLVVW